MTPWQLFLASDTAVRLAGQACLIGFVSGVLFMVAWRRLTASTYAAEHRRRMQADALTAQLRQECADAEARVKALERDALVRNEMYVHGLRLARRVDHSTCSAALKRASDQMDIYCREARLRNRGQRGAA